MIQTKDFRLFLAVVLQVLVVLIMVLWKMSVLGSGTTVFLRTEPVDPRDPLRGDYVTVQYQISSVPQYYLPRPVSRGETLYVSLAQGYDNSWEQSNVTLTKPTSGVFIKGVVEDPGVRFEPSKTDADPYSSGYEAPARLKFGIEDKFIPEGTGRGVSFFNHTVIMEVALDESGNAVAKNLYVDGQVWP